MSFQYVSMLDPTILNQIRQASERHFQFYDPQLHKSYGYAVPVGFERDVVSTIDGDVVYNDHDHPDEPGYHDLNIKLGTINDHPDDILMAYQLLVQNCHLDETNRDREQMIYDLRHSDIIAIDE